MSGIFFLSFVYFMFGYIHKCLPLSFVYFIRRCLGTFINVYLTLFIDVNLFFLIL